MEPERGPYFQYKGMSEAAGALQTLAMTAAEAITFSLAEAREYSALRRLFLREDELREALPPVIVNNASLRSLGAALQRKAPTTAIRQNQLVTDFMSFLNVVRERDDRQPFGMHVTVVAQTPDRAMEETARDVISSASWTGVTTKREKLLAAHALLPSAQYALEELLASLEVQSHNEAPLLNERTLALRDLKELHGVLGSIISLVEKNSFDGDLGEGLAADAVHYAKGAVEHLKGDPVPYAVATLLISILTACGFPGAGAFLATLAIEVRRR